MKCLTIVMAAGALVCAGCSGSSSPMSPTRADTAMSASARPFDGVPAVSAAQPGNVNQLLAGVRQATAAFHDVDKAIAAGYPDPTPIPCVQSPAGVMGKHAANMSLINDGVINETTPEVLLYLPKNGGGFRLVAVEYLQPILLRDPATGAVAPWFEPTPWPPEFEVLTPAPALFGHTFDGPMAGHEPGMPWHYDMHVWAWAPNPNGMFAQFNPSLSCTG